MPHYWEEPVEQVRQAFMSAKKKPSQIKERVFPTYKEGIELGLTPKYDHPALMLEQYVRDMERFKAGIDLMESLKQQRVIVPASVARVNPNFSPIHAPGFGTNDTNIMDVRYIGNWYAPTKEATQLNRLFSPEAETGLGKVLGKTAKFSAAVQDITLSGGVPGTPINAFTAAQVQKELLSGRIKSPLSAVYDSLSSKRTQSFFDTNADQIKKMLERNTEIRTGYSVDEMIDRKLATKIFGDGIGSAWSKLINEPTFKRFMPMLQINLFNDIETKAIKSGLGEKEAADIASKAVRNFYGLVGTDVRAGRSKIGKDLTTTILFAPHYRESMINTWVNTVKGISPVKAEFERSGITKVIPSKIGFNNPVSKENITNTRFAIGSVLTYLVMSKINKALNGHSMSENPEGKKDKLLIPVGDNQTIGVPFLSSIATIPRMGATMVGQLSRGDIAGASLEGRKALSMMIKPVIDLMANKDYFERDIVDEADTTSEKFKKQAEYLIKAYGGHPYLREIIELYTKPEKPTYQRLSMAMELPLRFYDTDKIELAPFWEKYHELKAVKARYDVLKKDDESKANDYLNENEEKINEFNLMKAYLKVDFDQKEAEEEPTGIKDYLALAKSESKYEVSEDAPQGFVDKALLYGKSAVVNPIDTFKAVTSGQPIRKMRGDATVLERQLGATDKDPDTQKDHRIPLWAGGSNTDSNTYYLSNEDHKAKTKFETPLRKRLESGELSKSQAQKQIKQWHEDNDIQSIAPPIETPSISTEVKAGIEAYKSGGGANVEERANWVKAQLDGFEGTKEDRQAFINDLYDEKVLTGTSRGTIAKLKEMGIDVSRYTGTTKGKTTGGKRRAKGKKGKKPKKITVKTPTFKKFTLKEFKPGIVKQVKAPILKKYKAKKIAVKVPESKKYKFGVIKPKVISGGRKSRLKAKR